MSAAEEFNFSSELSDDLDYIESLNLQDEIEGIESTEATPKKGVAPIQPAYRGSTAPSFAKPASPRISSPTPSKPLGTYTSPYNSGSTTSSFSSPSSTTSNFSSPYSNTTTTGGYTSPYNSSPSPYGSNYGTTASTNAFIPKKVETAESIINDLTAPSAEAVYQENLKRRQDALALNTSNIYDKNPNFFYLMYVLNFKEFRKPKAKPVFEAYVKAFKVMTTMGKRTLDAGFMEMRQAYPEKYETLKTLAKRRVQLKFDLQDDHAAMLFDGFYNGYIYTGNVKKDNEKFRRDTITPFFVSKIAHNTSLSVRADFDHAIFEAKMECKELFDKFEEGMNMPLAGESVGWKYYFMAFGSKALNKVLLPFTDPEKIEGKFGKASGYTMAWATETLNAMFEQDRMEEQYFRKYLKICEKIFSRNFPRLRQIYQSQLSSNAQSALVKNCRSMRDQNAGFCIHLLANPDAYTTQIDPYIIFCLRYIFYIGLGEVVDGNKNVKNILETQVKAFMRSGVGVAIGKKILKFALNLAVSFIPGGSCWLALVKGTLKFLF